MEFDLFDENNDSIIIMDNLESFDDVYSNQADSSGKRKRATSEQLNKIISFTETNSDFAKGFNKENIEDHHDNDIRRKI